MKYKGRRLITLLVAISYFIPFVTVFLHFWADNTTDYCYECRARSSGVVINQQCSPENPCDSPSHHHHNQPIHQHNNCSLCGHITKYVACITTSYQPDLQTISPHDISSNTTCRLVITCVNTPIRAPPSLG